MAGTIRTLAFALVLFAMAPCAAAQDLALPNRLDLNGVWELVEGWGQRLGDGPALVEITHSGATVVAKFIQGAECFDGAVRPDAFIAELRVHPTTPPTGLLSSPAMWVCSNDPALVKKCAGGLIKSIYKTTFSNAYVDPDFIDGTRVRQGVRGCNLDPSSNGTADFALRRLAPCELEQRLLEAREGEMDTLWSSLNRAPVIFTRAIDAARRRFGETYGNLPTNTLKYPSDAFSVTGSTETELLFSVLPDLIESAAWINARVMVTDMALGATPPLAEATPMLEEINRIESKAAEARRLFEAVHSARERLKKCQQAQP